MKPQIEARLAELRHEYDSGQQMLAELERRSNEVSQTLLRIGGAIQVLEEMLAADAAPDHPAA
ncbi:hypothetical protein [Chitinolyticbacter meiyuanensis]|uniref:hypothetical protein n=1 Tax=Chitinolyticbacter meiyuanensis TaxID=682798 RepID=UPI0011E588A0|nr:hypothetical protein [Chitinolyticbacter meiyuanensis]